MNHRSHLHPGDQQRPWEFLSDPKHRLHLRVHHLIYRRTDPGRQHKDLPNGQGDQQEPPQTTLGLRP